MPSPPLAASHTAPTSSTHSFVAPAQLPKWFIRLPRESRSIPATISGYRNGFSDRCMSRLRIDRSSLETNSSSARRRFRLSPHIGHTCVAMHSKNFCTAFGTLWGRRDCQHVEPFVIRRCGTQPSSADIRAGTTRTQRCASQSGDAKVDSRRRPREACDLSRVRAGPACFGH